MAPKEGTEMDGFIAYLAFWGLLANVAIGVRLGRSCSRGLRNLACEFYRVVSRD